MCDEVFNLQGDKVPRLLICGHTVCHQCLTRLTVHDRVILCPFDRQPTDIGNVTSLILLIENLFQPAMWNVRYKITYVLRYIQIY